MSNLLNRVNLLRWRIEKAIYVLEHDPSQNQYIRVALDYLKGVSDEEYTP